MKRQIDPSDLPLLNLILDRDQGLAATILGRLDSVTRALGPVTTQTPAPPRESSPIETRIVDWLRAHPGHHAPGAIREGLGVAAGDNQFKDALVNALGEGRIAAKGKGAGRKYWIA